MLGINATGFRTPHFGSFNNKGDIIFIHSLLSKMNYSFSSSSVPMWGFKLGPAIKKFSNIVEIPLTGFFSMPFNLLDSWGLRFAKKRTYGQEIYKKEILNYIDYCQNKQLFINLYVDPSQVYDWEDFFESIKMLAQFNCSSYSKFIKGKC